ncbi:MAG: transposase [Gammaproteobacteria bacterium]|nr:transposase [Gammaproteobacteria bacterium]
MYYRRARIPGASYLFTVVTEGRRPLLAAEDNVELLREAFRAVRAAHPFVLDAVVVLPDHLHCIWTLPPGDADFGRRWRLIKAKFSKGLAPVLRPVPNEARSAKRKQAVWQHRYWEHVLRDETDFRRHVDYIHYNPVKHGLTSSPAGWPYSSFRRHVEAGVYPADWGRDFVESTGVGKE